MVTIVVESATSMPKSTFLPLSSGVNILPRSTCSITAQSVLPVRPYRLWVDPQVAGSFLILDVLVGNRSILASRGAISAAKFSVGQGDRLDGDVVLPDEYVTLVVEHVGPEECGGPFRAAWAAVVLPLDVARAARRAGADPGLDPRLGVEDAGSRIQRVLVSDRSSSRDVGWDPYPD
jgi:hypothetical protein